VWKLNKNETKRTFERRLGKLVYVEAPDLWNSFKFEMLQVSDEACGVKRIRSVPGNTYW